MTQLDLVVKLCQSMSNAKVMDAELSGQIDILTEDIQATLINLDAEGHYHLPKEFKNISIGQTLEIRGVAVPRLRNLFFAETWEELLSHHDFRFNKPKNYFVLKTNFYSKNSTFDPCAQQYSKIIHLIELLKKIADADQENANRLTLLFLLKEKLELSIDYGADDFCDLPDLESLCRDFLIDDPHTEQRKSILKTALSEMLKNIPSDQRFKHLLNVFNELAKRARDNYELYVAGFSFEKIREEVQSNCLEYTLKLNKVFSEIQNQLLAVPAALLLIGSQMDDKIGWGLKNWAVWIGVVIFSIFMNMLLKNQHHSLKAISAEIDALKNKLTFEHKALADRLMPAYEDLDKRYEQQKKSLFCVEISIVAVLLFCTFLFAYSIVSVGEKNRYITSKTIQTLIWITCPNLITL